VRGALHAEHRAGLMSAPAPELPPAPSEPENDVKLSFMDHLRELRKRISRSLLGIVAGMAVVGFFVEQIFHRLMQPVLDSLPEKQRALHYTSYIEPLMVYLKVALYGGVFVAVPWVLYQLWQFIAPGLYRKEKRVVVPFLVSGTGLFYAGAIFCYFVIFPAAFPAMAAFATDPSLSPVLTMSEQLSLVLGMLLGFGIVFEVPVVIAFLALIGLVNWRWLAKYRRYAIVINVTIAAIITPTGDPLNLAFMAVPMILFYEIGIILARILGKKREDASIVKAEG
ncbi:MAG TPA: twin-arginine translocase subunit TatC, partial [Anaeromyxobacter sp.]|nr:twin-arginine translocase subunit TatC [Anaeromyxobacter sp.]